MKVAIYDTYVKRKNGDMMHFDIVVPVGTDETAVLEYGRKYLVTKGEETQELSSKECKFCHIEHLQKYMDNAIHSQGYYILEMAGC